jgi:two-component system, NarL family, sensor histidine kinase UhpB
LQPAALGGLLLVVKKDIRVLLLEDNEADAELIQHAMRQANLSFTLTRVESESEFLTQLERHTPDVVLLDYSVPGFDGLKALTIAQQKQPDIPSIFVTGTLGEEVVIDMLKSGATDYVLKTHLSRLGPALERALREAKERVERKKAEERLRKSHAQLRALSIYLQYVREDERSRISRQVHDELGQALTGLKMDLYWMSTRLPKDLRPVINKTKSMASHIDTTIQTVRRIATELRPGILDDLGLVPALEWQAQEFQQRTGIKCKVTSHLGETMLDEDLNTAFFRIFQETLTNVIRHAQAKRVEITLEQVGESLCMEVCDNGRGITEAEINNTHSIGLLGMRERAALLGGEVTFHGEPTKGTTVRVVIPLARTSVIAVNNENTYRRRSRSREAWAEANSG